MAANIQRGIMRALRIAEHPAVVTRIEDRAPWMRRIEVHAPQLTAALSGQPAEWVRAWIPSPLNPGQVKQRGLTVSLLEADSGHVAFDQFMHEPAGPASAWAASLDLGDRFTISLTPQRWHVSDDGPLLLLGDLASLPAIEALHAGLGRREMRIVLDPQGHRLEELDGLSPALLNDATLAADPLAALESLTPDTFVWAALSRQRISAVRSALRAAGHPRQHQHAQAYWVEGKPFS